jgi:transcriptional regulator with XRE-family HTH domain
MAKRLRLDMVTGAAIMRLRTEAGVSQDTLAKKLKISVPTISKMESGRPPDSVDIKMLADYFGVTTDEVCGRRSARTTTAQKPEEQIVRLGREAAAAGADSVASYVANSIVELSRKVEEQSRELSKLRKRRR